MHDLKEVAELYMFSDAFVHFEKVTTHLLEKNPYQIFVLIGFGRMNFYTGLCTKVITAVLVSNDDR